ncbi:MAG: hypothetical protein RMK99_03885 [Anaerolineales bacterium]|nr:hypothetical protein [Anaerolineales bacterium]
MISRPSYASIAATLALVISVVNGVIQTSRAQSLPQATVGSAFTYQGRLDDNGAPANGAYDFQFALFDAVTGGTQVGSTTTLNNVAVVNGIFTVQLDFGNPFWQQQTYLEVRVRKSGDPAFTTLTPRQPVSAAPVASALPGVYTNQAGQFVGLNRTNKITGNEVFGVNADFGPTGSTYGGMYINTVSPQGRPFYGYATGGLFRAWTTFNPADSAWELHNSTQLLLQVRAGSIAQPSDANGLVKAGVFATCSSSGSTIIRSFVAIDGTPPTATISWDSGQNTCVIDFGFNIIQRYFVATASANTPRFVACFPATSNTLACRRFRDDGVQENGNIMVLVY